MLQQRVITALVLLAILLPALFYTNTVPFTLVVLVLMAAGAWEWGRLSGFGQAGSVTVGVACVALCAGSWALGWVDRPSPGPLPDLRPGCSDSHRPPRTVCRVSTTLRLPW